jgi:CCR4-NOT transcription complex subunit 3
MERFKVCEKETKTKAYSKEGLAASAKKDAKSLAKLEIYEWIDVRQNSFLCFLFFTHECDA